MGISSWILTSVCLLVCLFLQKGITSPRAYVNYNCAADPDPKYFEQILQNSLSKEQIEQFCADFLALFRPKEHKRPVPCAIGATDSGKTSLFSPVFQIVPLSRIARVTKQKSFNKAMIDSSTEVIFLDEAHRELLDIDDWKIICQGGFTSHDAKWKKAEGFHCRASMYITCQQEMDFGEAHNEAMNRRLNKYHFRSLPSVEPQAIKWLREHAMDCIVWAQRMIATESNSSPTMPTEVLEEEGLASEDIQNILTVSVLDEHLTSCSQPESAEDELQSTEQPSSVESNSEESSTEGDWKKLREELARAVPAGIRHRQLTMLLKNVEARRKSRKRNAKTRRADRLAWRKMQLVNLNVMSKSQADRMISDPDVPLPASLEQREQQAIHERNERLAAQKLREDEEKVRRTFENAQLENMEKEMAEYNWRLEKTQLDANMRATLQSLLEINSDKLRGFHQNHGTLGMKLAVQERKKLCLKRGWVEEKVLDLVRDVYSPLPIIVDAVVSDVEGEQEEVVFLTPKTPSYIPSHEEPPPFTFSPHDTSQEYAEEALFLSTPKTPSYVPSTIDASASSSAPASPLPQVSFRKKRAAGPDRRHREKRRKSNTIRNYFSSQK